jgi:dihydroxyacetone kinase
VKKLVNAPADVVPQMLEGVALTNPGVTLLEGGVLVRADAEEQRRRGVVAVLSGGGAGHEPAHAGFVGPGMLSGAVVGDVFTSPSTDAVLAALRAVGGEAGVLLVVKNYTGDRLNFGLAAEIARQEGIPVEVVVVADDVALAADGRNAGRRGLAGTVLVHKVAGAAAEEGLPLAEVAAAAAAVAGAVGTMGVALSSCTVPAAGAPGFDLGQDDIEWGLGIHGEPGVERTANRPADEIVDRLLGQILGDRGIRAGDRVVVLVNNLGGTPPMELSIVARGALARLRSVGVTVERAWVGTFMTALEMAGCSLSVLSVDDTLLARLDAPSAAPAWPPAGQGRVALAVEPSVAPAVSTEVGHIPLPEDSQLRRAVVAVAATLADAEPELTAMDREVGDGDLGASLERGATALADALDRLPGEHPAATLRAMAAVVRRVVGGTSGPLYAVLLLRAAGALEDVPEPGPADWAAALSAGVEGVMELGGAEPGDATMVDALVPAARTLAAQAATAWPVALAAAVEAARDGATATAGLVARRGRASYVGGRAVGRVDPGAHAVTLWLAAVQRALAGTDRTTPSSSARP